MKIKTYKDYLQQVYDDFEDVDRKAIDKVIRVGLYNMSKFIQRGCDVFMYNHKAKLYYYFGETTQPSDRGKSNFKKHRRKLRVLHQMKKLPEDDVFYFGLTDEEYEQHLKGEAVETVWLYKLLKECQLTMRATHFFKVHQSIERKVWVTPIDNYETTSAEYIQRRDGKGFSAVGDTE